MTIVILRDNLVKQKFVEPRLKVVSNMSRGWMEWTSKQASDGANGSQLLRAWATTDQSTLEPVESLGATWTNMVAEGPIRSTPTQKCGRDNSIHCLDPSKSER